jgi:cell division septum initiation protein DivIVA
MPMFRRIEEAGAASGGAVPSAPEPVPAEARSGLPNLSGDLGGLLSRAPCFSVRIRGYDPLQVDNYVAWAESELETGRRQVDSLLTRYGACSAELDLSRRLLAQRPKGQDVSPVSDRVRNLLQLAAEEAQAMVDAAAEEAEGVRTDARMEADARLRKAHEIKEVAARTADELREQAERDRAEAAALLRTARAEAAELVGVATAERDRLREEAAEAQATLSAVQAEMDDLRRQRDEARALLDLLNDRIGRALSAVTGGPDDRFLLIDNRVDDRVESLST